MSKKYFWLKLKDDFFDGLRIKKLRSLAGGDTFTIIYLKMLLKSIKNDGVLTYQGIENNLCDEIALDINESPDNVNVTLKYLLSCGLAEYTDNDCFLPEASHLTGSETSAAERMRISRQRKKELECNNVTPMLHGCYTEIEKEKDIELYKDAEEEKEAMRLQLGNSSSSSYESITPCYTPTEQDIQKIITTWNSQKCTKDIQRITPMDRRWNNTLLCIRNDFEAFLTAIRDIDNQAYFANRYADRNQPVTYDSFIEPDNYLKYIEGNYRDAFGKDGESDGQRAYW